MRRLLTKTLTVVLLAPWITALSGTAARVTACPMHGTGAATGHQHPDVTTGAHGGQDVGHQSSHNDDSARGCNCAGDCGRSGAAFTFPSNELFRVLSSGIAEPIAAGEECSFSSTDQLLPLATGPPQRLQV